jgi:hypothetical protein
MFVMLTIAISFLFSFILSIPWFLRRYLCSSQVYLFILLIFLSSPQRSPISVYIKVDEVWTKGPHVLYLHLNAMESRVTRPVINRYFAGNRSRIGKYELIWEHEWHKKPLCVPNHMQQSSWETDSSSASQDLPFIYVLLSLPHSPILSQINQSTSSHTFSIRSVLILSSNLRLSVTSDLQNCSQRIHNRTVITY